MFTDTVILTLQAGKGGNGVVAWRREKYIPKGGPCGGSGGKGGDVILLADSNIASLDAYCNRRLLKAENGQQGGANKKRGRNGQDLLLKVPCGTLVTEAQTGKLLADLVEHGQRFVACYGGKGGRGNETFKTSVNRAPNFCTPGKPGEAHAIQLELKLIAHVGFVGFPNAGKSTLLKALSHAKTKTAAYPFTTLAPNLGYMQLSDYRHALLADIPGIMQGAHHNKGLGLKFLRHIERTRLLLFVLDAAAVDGRTPLEDYRVLQKELAAYSEEVVQKPWLVALNKIDEKQAAEHIEQFLAQSGVPKEQIFLISALRGDGIAALSEAFEASL